MSAADNTDELQGPDSPANSNGCRAFSRSYRMSKPAEFKAVFKKPMVSSDACFKILARENGGQVNRLGLAVSKKVDRKAVGRNRIKRVARESFRCHMIQKNQVSMDFVVLPRLDCNTRSNRQLFQSLENHWRRLQRKSADAADNNRKAMNG